MTTITVGSGIDLVAYFALGALALVVILGIGGLFILALIANKGGPDLSGRRSVAVYLFGISFITLWSGFLGAVITVAGAVSLIGNHAIGRGIGRYGACSMPTGRRCLPAVITNSPNDAAARVVVIGALILVASAVIYFLHLRRARMLSVEDADGAALRVGRTYVLTVLLISVLVAVPALILAIYAIFELAGPGVFGADSRTAAARFLLDAGFVGVAAGGIFIAHLRLDPPHLSPWGSRPAPSWPPAPDQGGAMPWTAGPVQPG